MELYILVSPGVLIELYTKLSIFSEFYKRGIFAETNRFISGE